TLAIRAQALGLQSGFEMPTKIGGSRNGKDIGTVDLVLESSGVFHLYDLKNKGSKRDWVNKYAEYYPQEGAVRGTILEEEKYKPILARIFYYEINDPKYVYVITLSLPEKSGIIEYEFSKIEIKDATPQRQKEIVEEKGYVYDESKFRVIDPAADLAALSAGK